MVSTSFMVDTSSHPRAQLHRCVEKSAYRERGTMLGGTRRRKGRRRVERTTVRKHGKGPEPCKPVNEMALDSRTGEVALNP